MMKRKKILSIGTDTTISDHQSPFYKRFTLYDRYHDHTLLVLGKGKKNMLHIGSSKVILVGGRTKMTSLFATVRIAVQEVRSGAYDLITTQDVLYTGLVGYVASRCGRLPLFVQLHGDYLDNERWFKSKIGTFNRLMNIVGRFVLKQSDYIRVVSARLKKQIIKRYDASPDQIISIPIGTDISMFTASSEVNREPLIVFAQRLILEKQPMLFVTVTIEVMKTMPEVKVKIAGDGILKEEMEAAYAAAGLSDKVTFIGAVQQSELVELYQKAKCYLHTADWEGWGMPMIEAMAAGCPVVTTDTGCAGEAVQDGKNGFVTPVNDVGALVSAVKVLLSDTDLWHKFSKESMIEAQRWSFESLTHLNMEWYAQNS